MSKNHIVKLKDVISTKIQNGYSPLCQEYSSGVWVLSLGALTGYSFDSSQIKAVSSTVKMPEEYRLKDNDILVSRSNTLDKVGRCGVFHGEIENCFYPDLMMRFRADEEFVLTKYLEIVLQSEVARKYFQERAAGTSVSMMKINKKILEDFSFSLPSLKEQGKIIEITQVWDSAIEKTEKLISEKEEMVNAISQRIFRKSGIKHKISEYLTIRNEKCIPDDSIPLYSLTIEDGVTPKSDRYDREALVKDTDEKEYKVVYPGDIVFNPANLRWGAIARSNETNKVAVSPIYEVLSLDTAKINSDYLTFLLTSKDKIQYYSTKTEGTLVERMAVKVDVFLNFEIEIEEDYEKQKASAEVLTVLKKEISLLKKQLEQYKLQKQGLMQKLLTGEWRIK